MSSINTPLMPELEPFRDDLSYFFETMVRKLHICREKGFSEGKTINELFEGLDNEVRELELSLAAESQFQSALEAVDVANMAFLVALRVWSLTRSQYNLESLDFNYGGKDDS